MKTFFESLVTERALALVNARYGSALMDQIAADSVEHNVPTRNVCAKVSIPLADEIDRVCELLGLQKRSFLEAAFVTAVERAYEILRAEGVEGIEANDNGDQDA